MEYNHKVIEKNWQKYWYDNKVFELNTGVSKQKYYVLEMLPYPSGKIHMGHVRNYTIGDVIARYKMLKGYNVLHPMGWDAFGLPAENAAIENNTNPKDWTYQNIDSMRKQLKSLGFSYDWSREFATCDVEYYKHEQKIFLDFLKKGIAYQKESYVNWDPVDQTVLANEQVVDGKGWRSGAIVEKKKLKQWFLRITDFAEELLKDIDNCLEGWPEAVKSIQKKWIGKSEGAIINFKIKDKEDVIEIFSTRPETIFGATFCGISPFHPLAVEIAKRDYNAKEFISECENISTSEEDLEKAEKKGYDTGLKVIHPFTNKELPLFIANFILMEYGTGAIFGCPAHDERDFEFAKKYKIEIKSIINSEENSNNKPYLGDGLLKDSDFLNGLKVIEAKQEIIENLEKTKKGFRKVNYRLRDWGISRQRYWGCPIPIIYCDDCNVVPVSEDSLPVTLPEDVKFCKTGNALDHHLTWKKVKCPNCGKDAKRETDTFDTFFESSWYFFRYCSPKATTAFEKEITEKMMPVDQYIGGIEHAAMHLLYARFFTRALNECNYTNIKEPFKNLLTQGMVLHETYKDNNGNWIYPEQARELTNVKVGRVEKMSKSKKNVIDPEMIIKKYGADTARFFMMSDTPPERDLEWSSAGIEGSYKFIKRVYNFIENFTKVEGNFDSIKDPKAISIRKITHKSIDAITKNIEKINLNSAIANIRELANNLIAQNSENKEIKLSLYEGIENLILLISPFTPHLAEELWQKIGKKTTINQETWPIAKSEFLLDSLIIIPVQVNGKLRSTIEVEKNITKEEMENLAINNVNVKKFIGNNQIKKIIVIPGKVVNVVI